MISPRWRKVLRDLWGNKARTLLVILSIAVGVAALGVVGSTYSILSNELPAEYIKVNPAAAIITTDIFDSDFLLVIRNLPQIEQVEGRFTLTVRLQIGENDWRDLQLIVIPDYNNIAINKFWPEKGAWPPAENEVLIERSALALSGSNIGDLLYIQTPEGKRRELRVAGLVHDITTPSSTFSNRVKGYITVDTLEWLGYPRAYNEILITIKGHPKTLGAIRKVTDIVTDKVRKSDRVIYGLDIPEPGKHWFEPYLTPMATLLVFLGGLILFLSSFLVINLITGLLAQQVRQIGIMKSIGGKTSQIMRMYLFFVGVMGFCALICAVPLAYYGTRTTIGLLTTLINFDIANIQIPQNILIIQAIVSLGVPLAVAIFPIIASTRVTVREAINDPGLTKVNYGRTIFDRLLGSLRGLSRPMMLSLRNTFRKKTRLVLTLITLTLGSAIFIAVMSVYDGLNLTLEKSLEYYRFDIVVFFNRPYRVEQILDEVNTVEGVSTAETWGINSGRIVRGDGSTTQNITIAAPPNPTSLIYPTLLSGRWLLPEDEDAIVVNTDVQNEYPYIKIGNYINLKVGDQTTSWRVVGIVRSVLIGPWGYTNYSYFSKIFGRFGLASAVYIATRQHDQAYQESLARSLEQHFNRVGLRVSSINKVAELRSSASQQFNVIILFLVIMAVLLTLVGSFGLAGTMSLNVLERTREIGVLRAIGASNASVMRIVLTEGVLIGGLGWVFGGLLSYPLSQWLSRIVGNGFLNAPLEFAFSYQGAVAWLGVMVVLSVLASYVPAHSATRLSVRDTLAYE